MYDTLIYLYNDSQAEVNVIRNDKLMFWEVSNLNNNKSCRGENLLQVLTECDFPDNDIHNLYTEITNNHMKRLSNLLSIVVNSE